MSLLAPFSSLVHKGQILRNLALLAFFLLALISGCRGSFESPTDRDRQVQSKPLVGDEHNTYATHPNVNYNTRDQQAWIKNGVNPFPQADADSVILVSSDGQTFKVDRDVAEQSKLIKNILVGLGDSNSPIPLPNATAAVLTKVLQFCERQCNGHLQIDHHGCVIESDWETKFMEVDRNMILDLIVAAKYLDIPLLSNVCVKTISKMVQGKSSNEIRMMFNIVNDFAPEEEEEEEDEEVQIKKENEWVEGSY